MSFGGHAQSAMIVTKNNLGMLRKSSHKGHKFLNVGKTDFSDKKSNNNFTVADTNDVHTSRAKKEAILITLFVIIPFATFFMYWLGVI